jgi:hypothetical protein
LRLVKDGLNGLDENTPTSKQPVADDSLWIVARYEEQEGVGWKYRWMCIGGIGMDVWFVTGTRSENAELASYIDTTSAEDNKENPAMGGIWCPGRVSMDRIVASKM